MHHVVAVGVLDISRAKGVRGEVNVLTLEVEEVTLPGTADGSI